MGPGLRLALICALVVVGSLPDQADARRFRHPKARPAPAAPPAEGPVERTPQPAISLSGTYVLTRILGRPVREPELAQSRLTFNPRFNVVGQTACNSFQTRLVRGPNAQRILVFDTITATERACPPRQIQAQETTFRLLTETANIARAGETVSLFNINGIAIAQLAAVTTSPTPTPEASAPPRGAPVPTRANFGDYILNELGGQPVAVRAPPSTVPRPVYAANTRFITIAPTLYARENNAISGLAGCNQYNTSLTTLASGTQRFGPVATTRKACLDRATTRTEQEVLTAFREATRVDVNANRVSLYRANGTRLARFTSVGARSNNGPSLFGQNWVLRSLNGVPVRLTNPPTMSFEGNQVIGFAGCNRFNMIHDRRNGRSDFKDASMTRMACPDRAHSDLEQSFMAGLNAVTTTSLTATQLTLRSADNTTIMVFEAD